MTAPFSDELLARLGAFATAEFGLRFPPDRWNELGRGIASAALEQGVADLEGWAESLAAGRLGADDRAAVANHLTISETYFFRQLDAFNALEREILPARIAQRRQHAQALRIWSAGCASGEEAYSIAVLLRQRFPDVRRETIAIRGTDLNSRVVERARRGLYSEWSFRDAPPWLKAAYFERAERSHFQISAEIRGMVRFSQLNLADPLYPAEFGDRGDFDVILCRNVLMYFSAEWQDTIIRRLTRALAPGGWLIVGPCDVTAAESAELHLRPTSPGIYQKRARGDEGSSAPLRLPLEQPEQPTPSEAMSSPGEWPVLELAPSAEIEATTSPVFRDVQPSAAASPPPGLAPNESIADAYAHADRGELEEALEACSRAAATDNLDPALYQLRGYVLMELERFAEAEEAFKRVLYLEPQSVMAEFALASLAQRASRKDEARHRFALVLRLLAKRNRGDAVPNSDGLTVGRLQEVVQRTLDDHAA